LATVRHVFGALAKSFQTVPRRRSLRCRSRRAIALSHRPGLEGVPLGMHRMNPECLDSDPSGRSITLTILLREEPDDEDEEEHDGGGGEDEEEDDDGDEGYSE
jgi:hypothetical protein